MKLKGVLQIAIFVLVSAISAHSAYALRTIGNNPFYQKPIKSEVELKNMLLAQKNDVEKGLTKAGYPQLYEPLYLQLNDIEVSRVQYTQGKTLDWMFYRKNGKGPVRVDKKVVWESIEPLDSYEFALDYKGQRYTMVVPLICGNLALAKVSPAPAAEAVVTPAGDSSEQRKTADSARFPILFDAGYLYQFDPAHHLFFRAGTEYAFTDSFSVIGMLGGAPRFDGEDGKSALIVDVFANYSFSRFFLGAGLGGWLTSGDDDVDAEDDGLDVIVNFGSRIFGEPDDFNTSLFVELRSAVDEFEDFDRFGRVGVGLRFRF